MCTTLVSVAALLLIKYTRFLQWLPNISELHGVERYRYIPIQEKMFAKQATICISFRIDEAIHMLEVNYLCCRFLCYCEPQQTERSLKCCSSVATFLQVCVLLPVFVL